MTDFRRYQRARSDLPAGTKTSFNPGSPDAPEVAEQEFEKEATSVAHLRDMCGAAKAASNTPLHCEA